MSILETKLTELSGSTDANALAFAKKANDLKKLIEEKKISHAEYKELMADLQSSQVLSQSASDLAVRSAVHEILIGIESAAGALL